MTTRRGFLGAIAAAAGALTLDPERALWVPGKKLISIPAPVRYSQVAIEVVKAEWKTMNGDQIVTDAFIRCGALKPGRNLSRDQLAYGHRVLGRVLHEFAEKPAERGLVGAVAAELLPAYSVTRGLGYFRKVSGPPLAWSFVRGSARPELPEE